MSDIWDDYMWQRAEHMRRYTPLKCKDHPRYQAKRKPRVACEMCWRMWIEKSP